jgi:mRNA interferase MazF
MVSRYVPERGHLVWLDFSPQAGREQAGRRPALVLSGKEYNRKTGRCIACPVTSHIKGYPFEMVLPQGLPITGAVLADHMKNQDWQARQVVLIDKVDADFVDSVADIVEGLVRAG